MSDTTRTDTLMQAKFVELGSLGPHNCPEWLVVHARQLERELHNLNLVYQEGITHRICLQDALNSKTAECDRLKAKVAEMDTAIKNFLPFALEDYYPDEATVEYRQVFEAICKCQQ